MKKDSLRESIFNILRYIKGRLEVSYNSGSDYL